MRANRTPGVNPSSVRWRLRVPLLAALLLLPAGLFCGCGEPVVGGSGRLVAGANGAPDLLILRGSPRQMGWWHGKLLDARIRALAARWQRAAIGGAVGAHGDTKAGAAGSLREAVDLYVDIARERLPEVVRQELDGMAEATGLSPATLLFTEVMRDGLRVYVRNHDPRLPGGLAGLEAGPAARVFWSGPDAAILADELLVTIRVPDAGVASVAVAWPGALGGLAGLSARRVAYLTGEADVAAEMRGFGRGVPFSIAARVATERERDVDRIRAAMGGTAGHALLVLSDAEPRAGAERRRVVGSIEAYRGVQPEIAGPELGYVLLGSDQDVRAGLARSGLSERPATSEGLEARVYAAARQLARPAGDARDASSAGVREGPSVSIIWRADRTIELEARRSPDGAPQRAVLRADGSF